MLAKPEAGWQLQTTASNPPLAVATRGSEQAPWARIYIEGDGRAFRDAEHVSADPTPLQATALQKALADTTAPRVIYLARPGQFGTAEGLRRWWWSDGRFSPEAIQLYRNLVPTLAKGKPVELVGYSGGGAIVMALGAYAKQDGLAVRRIVTLAGNLNPNAVNKAHNIPPFQNLDTSLQNPLAQPSPIPEEHWFGTRDTIVTPRLQKEWQATAESSGRCSRFAQIDATHWARWEQATLDSPIPSCEGLK